MKKSLIALAVLAASGAAMAQSSVTLYGVADVVIHKDKGVDTKMTSGGVSTSRLGFKGTEDLGGGLKANFKLEQKVDLTNGAAGNFGREAWVGLSGGFGEVQLGNTYTAYDNVAGAADPALDANVIDPTAILASRFYISNPGSNITYTTPSFGGFSGGLSYSLDGSKNEVLGLSLSYANGPLAVNLGYQDQEDFATAAIVANVADGTYTGTVDQIAKKALLDGNVPAQFTTVNASYDFGSFKLLGGFANVSTDAEDAKDYFIGVDVPVASNVVVSAGYAVTDIDNAADKGTSFGVAVAYMLSKRTTAYAGIRADNQFAVDNLGGVKNRFGVGIKHSF